MDVVVADGRSVVMKASATVWPPELHDSADDGAPRPFTLPIDVRTFLHGAGSLQLKFGCERLATSSSVALDRAEVFVT